MKSVLEDFLEIVPAGIVLGIILLLIFTGLNFDGFFGVIARVFSKMTFG